MEKITLKKTCSFYVSDFHLSTLLLPYIINKIEKKSEIKTFLEESIEEKMLKLVKGLNIEEESKKKILKINWDKFDLNIYNNMAENININNNIHMIVTGKKEYIENINQNIEKFIDVLNMQDLKNSTEIVINNCYRVQDVLNIQDVLDKHDLILNTSGEVEIPLVYEAYKKTKNLHNL